MPTEYERTHINEYDDGRLRRLSCFAITVDGIHGSRDSVNTARVMIELFEDSPYPHHAYHYRPGATVDEDRYVRTGKVHTLGCAGATCRGGGNCG